MKYKKTILFFIAFFLLQSFNLESHGRRHRSSRSMRFWGGPGYRHGGHGYWGSGYRGGYWGRRGPGFGFYIGI